LKSLVSAYCLGECCFLSTHSLAQGSATYGPPSKTIRPAAPLQIAWLYGPPSGIMFYELALLQAPCNFLYRLLMMSYSTYEKPNCAVNVAY